MISESLGRVDMHVRGVFWRSSDDKTLRSCADGDRDVSIAASDQNTSR